MTNPAPACSRTPKPPVAGRGFGRLVSYDLRDAAHPMRAHLSAALPTVTHRAWSAKEAVDQGASSACTGFSALNLLRCGPVLNTKDVPTGDVLYDLARRNDEWLGEDYDGSSVRGAMKGLQSLGYITAYVWTNAVHDITDWLLTKGPVVLGTAWTDKMCDPVTRGKSGFPYVVVDRDRISDPDAEGHAWCAHATNVTARNPNGTVGWIELINSWGPSFGREGKARLTLEDLAVLLSAGGECCTPTEIRKVVVGG